jgi:hypothetical protein
VDLFRVEGGTTHDWIVHHAGPAPQFSTAMAAGTFAPKDWLYNGTDRVLAGRPAGTWDARWKVGGVTSRLTMAGADGTEVFGLETYPVDNAVVTAKDPPCQSLVVRRSNDRPFMAVWDAWRDRPNLEAVLPGDSPQSLCLKTKANRYDLLFGPGEARFEGGVRVKTDAVFAIWREPGAAMFVGGTSMAVESPGGRLELVVPKTATVAVEFSGGKAAITTAGDIRYDTIGGVDRERPAPPVQVAIKGDLWPAASSQTLPSKQVR